MANGQDVLATPDASHEMFQRATSQPKSALEDLEGERTFLHALAKFCRRKLTGG